AHTLKGVSGNLGLTPLYDPVTVMVSALRDETKPVQLEPLFAAIEAGYSSVIAVLNAAKP
ncbi:MAG: Hpt domain-containing protein, partial [Spirochaetia bacterium]|nr:Hpt domain-containing protein [Spirochaetia bacterium]